MHDVAIAYVAGTFAVAVELDFVQTSDDTHVASFEVQIELVEGSHLVGLADAFVFAVVRSTDVAAAQACSDVVAVAVDAAEVLAGFYAAAEAVVRPATAVVAVGIVVVAVVVGLAVVVVEVVVLAEEDAVVFLDIVVAEEFYCHTVFAADLIESLFGLHVAAVLHFVVVMLFC